jgi:hypothetical protein
MPKNVRKPPAKKYKDSEDEYASSSGSEDRPFGRGAPKDESSEEEEEEVFNLAGSGEEEEEDDYSSVSMLWNLCKFALV